MTPLGYQALIAQYGIQCPPLAQVYVLSPKTGLVKHSIAADGSERTEIPRNRYSGGTDTVAHLTFALRRERLNLTVLSAVFSHEEATQAVQEWLRATPSSIYARIAGHLAKWLKGVSFEFVLPPGAQRVSVLDERQYIVAPAVADPQFGVLNNLLGSPAFCPIVRKTDTLNALLALNLREKVTQAISRIDPEVLVRAVDYLYLSETRSTFSIEKEIPDNQRAAKFRQLLEIAGEPGLVTEEQLCGWQNQIMSSYAAEASYRTQQNWLSRSGRLRNIADYIPPSPEYVHPMMEGVAKVAQLGADNLIDPAVAAACAAFGFVFVHPFMDGNGRLHRFLIHHILRQSGYTPTGVVLPISARMLKSLDRYSKLLKSYSTPRTALLDYVLDDDSGTILLRSPQPLWLYASFDATEICEFLLACVAQCVEEDLAQEVKYLEAFDRTKTRLEAWLDMPQPQLSLLIRLIVQGNGELSERKRKRFDTLSEAALVRAEEVVSDEFADYIGVFGATLD
jgi:hypothetical protein